MSTLPTQEERTRLLDSSFKNSCIGYGLGTASAAIALTTPFTIAVIGFPVAHHFIKLSKQYYDTYEYATTRNYITAEM